PDAMHLISYLGVAKAVDGVLDEFYGRNYKGDIVTIMHNTDPEKNGHHKPFFTLTPYNVYSPYGMTWHKN
ncbi:MAG: hypothetical protein OXC48_08090, partial [Endozoicomonadaceae bacterium]|nr:hypothetical protein [Endozoicomonadaceae bacterium]